MADVLDTGTEAAIRRWVGSLDQVEGLEERVARLVEPAAVALEIALERLGDLAMSDSVWRAGDEGTTRTAEDTKRAEALVGRIVAYLSTGGVSLNGAAGELLAQAAADPAVRVVSSVLATINHSRPG